MKELIYINRRSTKTATFDVKEFLKRGALLADKLIHFWVKTFGAFYFLTFSLPGTISNNEVGGWLVNLRIFTNIFKL